MLALSDAKREYGTQDMQDWFAYWSDVGKKDTRLEFSPHFPLRTVLPLRMSIEKPELTEALYEGAWRLGIDVGDVRATCDYLAPIVRDSEWLESIRNGTHDFGESKRILIENTKRASEELGICGVPTYQVVDGKSRELCLAWGQDRLNVVEDALSARESSAL